MTILFVVVEYLCGSLMFSYWLARMVKKDLKKVGDGNPGAFNLWHTAGYKLGLLGVILDFMKGYLPLAILIEHGLIEGMVVIPVAIAPILGHAFSPFLRFKGGKAIAVSFGVWSALTRFEVSFVYAVILAIFVLVAKQVTKGKPTSTETDALMAVSGMALLGIYIIFKAFPGHFIILWLCNLFILVYANRGKLYILAKEIHNKYEDKDLSSWFKHS